MRIWVTTIISDDSNQIWNTAHATEEQAKDSVFDYIKANWGRKWQASLGIPVPTDRDAAIDEWFSQYDDYHIEQVILDYEPRVLVIVSGGIADWETDPGVKVAKFDLDDWEAEDDAGRREYKENLEGFEHLTPDWIKDKLED